MKEPGAGEDVAARAGKGWLRWWEGLRPADRKLLLRIGALAIVGVALMVAFGGGQRKVEEPQSVMAAAQQAAQVDAGDTLEAKLTQVLSSVKGAGRVQVAIAYQGSASAQYVFDSSDTSDPERQESSRQLSVADGQPVLIGTSAAEIRGVAITAQGAGDPVVRERLYQAATGLLGVGAERIAIVEAEGGNTDVIP